MDTFTWKTAPFSWTLAERISRELDLPLLAGIVLARRGFDSPQAARAFLDTDPYVPDPFLFADMERAVTLLSDAVDSGRRVVVHGDYDVDGISATALMVRGLHDFGHEAVPYLPSRFVQGYGLSRGAVEEIAAQGDALLVTVDCGVNYPEEVALARSLGLEVIVTDHHLPGDVLPEGSVVHWTVGDYPSGDLCGVGLALKVLHGLHVFRSDAPRDRLPAALIDHLDLVALGVVADLVPLVGENRYYVREGLSILGRTSKVGLRALLDVAGVTAPVDAYAVGFRLGPRLNAAGRMRDPQAPLRLLLTDDPHEADSVAAELDALNRERQEVEGRIMAEAVEQVEALDGLPTLLVLSGEGWHEGVVGIVASRLVEKYHRPTVLLSLKNGQAKGSGRSIPPYDLMEGLRSCESMLTVYGGHRQAAGMTLPSTGVPAFSTCLRRHADAALAERDLDRLYAPDALVRGQDLTLQTVDALERLAPFGMGNPRIHLLALDARLERVEKTRSGDHLRCTVVVDEVRTRGIGFRFADKLPALADAGYSVHAGLRLEKSEWQGSARCELHLHSLYGRPDQGESSLGCSPDCPFRDDLQAPAACPGCADPFAGQPDGGLPDTRDLRDQPGSLSALAQVIASGEEAAVIGASASRALRAVARLPLERLGVAGVRCVSRLCWRTHMPPSRDRDLTVLDWTAAMSRPDLREGLRHLLVLEPPFLASHGALLRSLAAQGARIHLLYGSEEREASVDTLRFDLHPRFWMVALYRSWMSGVTGPAAWEDAARRGWAEGEALPSGDDLRRAEAMLAEVGVPPTGALTATMKAENSAAYRAAEAAYREAVARCRRM